jgi:hypothetical protein
MILSLQSFEPAPTQSKPGRRILQVPVSLEQPTHRSGGNPQRRVLGPDHPDTLYSMSNLASVYRRQGKYAQAEALHSQTLEVRRRVLGAEHPDAKTNP